MIDCQGNAPARKKIHNAPAGKEFHLISSIVKLFNVLKIIKEQQAKLQRINDADRFRIFRLYEMCELKNSSADDFLVWSQPPHSLTSSQSQPIVSL